MSFRKIIIRRENQFKSFYNQRFFNSKELNCIIKNRIILNNKIIDHEIVHGIETYPVEVIAVYSLSNNLIYRVDFLK